MPFALGNMGGLYSRAYAINGAGQIVGQRGPSPDLEGQDLASARGFLWYRDVTTQMGFGFTAWATDINADGVVVGRGEARFDGLAPEANAWVWEQGVTTSLPLPPSNPLTGANAINLAGHIVGFLEEQDSGVRHATLWKRN